MIEYDFATLEQKVLALMNHVQSVALGTHVPTKTERTKEQRSKPMTDKYQPKTQKAKGLVAMDGLFDLYTPSHQIYPAAGIYRYDPFDMATEYFARPCPTVPRHGFVDSRLVRSRKELISLALEACKADPHAEIALGRAYDPEVLRSSAIITEDGAFCVGKGNDGATAGHDSYQLYVAPLAVDPHTKYRAGVKENSYLELLYVRETWASSTKPVLVQLRDGPKVGTIALDYIPADVTVMRVVTPGADLLEWERTCVALKAEPGVVAYAPGAGLISHAAIHCVINGIPFMTTREPQVGETIKAEGAKAPALRRAAFNAGVQAGLGMEGRTLRDEGIPAVLTVLHNWAYMRNSLHAATLLGAAAAIFVKLAFVLCKGEYRLRTDAGRRFSRNSIYSRWLNARSSRDGSVFGRGLRALMRGFVTAPFQGGCGGAPWAQIAYMAHTLWEATTKVANRRGGGGELADKEVSGIVSLLNRFVNFVHNNSDSVWFDKVAARSEMDKAAEAAGEYAMRRGHTLYQLLSTADACAVRPLKGARRPRLAEEVREEIGLENPAPKVEHKEPAPVPPAAALPTEPLGGVSYIQYRRLKEESMYRIQFIGINNYQENDMYIPNGLPEGALDSPSKFSPSTWMYSKVLRAAPDITSGLVFSWEADGFCVTEAATGEVWARGLLPPSLQQAGAVGCQCAMCVKKKAAAAKKNNINFEVEV